jgi:CRISPR-associated endonuclease Cas2
MSFVIAYDIKDDKRLRKIAKFMEKEAIRIQLSVFFLREATKDDILKIVKKSKEIMENEDDFRIYKVDMKYSLIFDSNEELKGMVL